MEGRVLGSVHVMVEEDLLLVECGAVGLPPHPSPSLKFFFGNRFLFLTSHLFIFSSVQIRAHVYSIGVCCVFPSFLFFVFFTCPTFSSSLIRHVY